MKVKIELEKFLFQEGIKGELEKFLFEERKSIIFIFYMYYFYVYLLFLCIFIIVFFMKFVSVCYWCLCLYQRFIEWYIMVLYFRYYKFYCKN